MTNLSKQFALLRFLPDEQSAAEGYMPPEIKDSTGAIIEQKLVHGVKALNPAAMGIQAEWLLLCLTAQRVDPAFASQALALCKANPKVRLFFRQLHLAIQGYAPQPTPFAAQLCGIAPTFVLVQRSYLIELSGFNESLSHAFDLDLYLRALVKTEGALAVCPNNSVPAVSTLDYSLLMGAKRVLQACQLALRYSKTAPAYWFLAYEQALKKMQADPKSGALVEPEKLNEHLKYLAAQVAARIKPSEQVAMGAYLP
jgi:hypothetical protein